ncbi:MAG: MFS transporter, partial [Rickettsia endosymbiont of Ixodes persulcatus]|nr:MFS transporter [Rickettsia endosymbiont of Ixodes persulcatus]
MIINQSSIKQHEAIIAYFIVAMFLCFEMALQVSPGVMTKQLMTDLHINIAELGFMSGAYFYTYAAMQIPAGLLFARFNLRYVVSAALVFCISGVLLLATANHLWISVLARILMGTGSAFGFVSVLVVTSRYFQPKHFAFLVGIAQLLAAIGAICGVAPLNSFVNLVGWRMALIYLALFGMALVILILIFIRRNECAKEQNLFREKPKIIKGLFSILRLKQNWIVASYAFFSWVPITAFASLWGIPYLTAAYQLNSITASTMIAMIWVGVALGSPITGLISENISSRRTPLFIVALIGLLSSSLVIYCQMNLALLLILLFLIGVGCSGQALSFAVVKDNNFQHESVAIGFNNMAVVITGGLVQPIIGFMINTALHTENRHTELFSYKVVLWIIPLSFLMCSILSRVLIKESYPITNHLQEKT